MQITINTDFSATENALYQFTDLLEREASNENYNALTFARHTLQIYVPEIPGQLYERTGRLGRSWVISGAGPRSWTISNNARSPSGRRKRYAIHVHGNSLGQRQAFVHSSRNPRRLKAWPIARIVIMSERAKAVRRLSRLVRTLARRVGL